MKPLCLSWAFRSGRPILLATLILPLALSAGCRPTPPPPLPTATATPAPSPTSKSGPATLRIDVKPDGAVVKLDGVEQGQSPLTLTPAPATYRLVIEHEGFAPLEETLTLEPGGEAMVAGMLTDIEPPQLAVRLSPSQIAAGQTVGIRIMADDNVAVTQLELLLNEEPLGEELDSRVAAQPLDVAWTPEDAGVYQLVVRAADAAGNVAEEELAVTVAEAPTATPTLTSTPTATPVPPTATPTSAPAIGAEVTASSLNVRAGPGTGFRRIGTAQRGQRLTVLARNAESTWLQICCVDGQQGWASVDYVKLNQPVEDIPTVTVTPSAPVGAPPPSMPLPVTVQEITITIPTYPYAPFLQDAVDAAHGNFPLKVLYRAAYEASDPQPEPKEYRLIVVENQFLRLTFLPELGGRVYECFFKPTGHNQFYRNPVIKPTHWGPPTPEGANWWLAAGGLEWGLPVEEHGYAWSIPWGYRISRGDDGDGSVTVHLSGGEGDHLRVRMAVTMRPGLAAFSIQTKLENPTGQVVRYQFWNNAMLAPGSGNSLSEGLQFIFPASEMTAHSTDDPRLPGAGEPFSWPIHQGRNVSRLNTWQGYLGFFERPAAQGDFVGVYDHADDEGMARIFPSSVARGAKGFAFGWGDAAIGADNWTDNGSGYVELHGGVAPTFDDWAELAAGQTLSWEETWFPVAGVGGFLYAGEGGAINLHLEAGGLRVSLFVTRRLAGQLVVLLDEVRIFSEEVSVSPDRPFSQVVALPDDAPAQGRVGVSLVDPNDGTPYVAMPPQEVALQ